MKKVFILVALIVQLHCGNLLSQVTIAPTNLFIPDDNRFGTYLVINGSNQTQEVSVEFFFGYAITNENGDRENVSGEEATESSHSIVESVRAFPQNFVLQPNQRQVVRLRITPQNDLEDGTYWARIKTTSTPESPPVEVGSDENVSARVGINIEQVTGLFYKNGDVTTGIEVDEIRTSISEENGKNLIILTDFKRTGNSPFLGSISTRLLNQNGEVVAQGFRSTSLYFDGTLREILDITELSSGEYTVQVDFASSRSDVSSDDLVQMEPVTATTTITIP